MNEALVGNGVHLLRGSCLAKRQGWLARYAKRPHFPLEVDVLACFSDTAWGCVRVLIVLSRESIVVVGT